jgi:hypothetical protein
MIDQEIEKKKANKNVNIIESHSYAKCADPSPPSLLNLPLKFNYDNKRVRF